MGKTNFIPNFATPFGLTPLPKEIEERIHSYRKSLTVILKVLTHTNFIPQGLLIKFHPSLLFNILGVNSAWISSRTPSLLIEFAPFLTLSDRQYTHNIAISIKYMTAIHILVASSLMLIVIKYYSTQKRKLSMSRAECESLNFFGFGTPTFIVCWMKTISPIWSICIPWVLSLSP